MPDLEFNTKPGQTVGREEVQALLNVGTSEAEDWAPLGKRVSASDISIDWGSDTVSDILGTTWTTLKRPAKEQSFDPMPLDAGDRAAVKLWNLAFREEDYHALANQDMMICHTFVGAPNQKFAERYPSSSVSVTRLGGDGGGTLTIGVTVQYGGERMIGTLAKGENGKIEFSKTTE